MQANQDNANVQIESLTSRLRTAEAAQVKSTSELEAMLREERESAFRQRLESQRLHLNLQTEEEALQAERTIRNNDLYASSPGNFVLGTASQYGPSGPSTAAHPDV